MNKVLARKWRPKNFAEVIGQEHVVRALNNAVLQNRLHHAYLFTGTRGVGKTTIARIFAKCLNCETGITATPCCKCDACLAIDSGSYLDLIEVDAASRTKVEDTRDLLENIHYLPAGRFKVYLIDEVHMLSGHSFNALLKTLEEPPAHVKFLLATTDPQKLPITVLSRCLQFNLKILAPHLIQKQLSFVLDAENIPYEQEGLTKIAQASFGSVRDALSLLDQAIAYGNNKITATEISAMLGLVESSEVVKLLEALFAKTKESANIILQLIAGLSENAADFNNVLEELLTALHHIAILQLVPNLSAIDVQSFTNLEKLQELAAKFTPEEVQLYYQIALIGKRDLHLAPNLKSGFEMVMLRMLAFMPGGKIVETSHKGISNVKPKSEKNPPKNDHGNDNQNNLDILAKLKVSGTTLALIRCCSIVKITDDTAELLLDAKQAPLLNKTQEERLAKAFSEYLQKPMKVVINIGKSTSSTLASLETETMQKQKALAEQAILADTKAQKIAQKFGVELGKDVELLNDEDAV